MDNIMSSSEYTAFNSYGGFNKSGDEYHILNHKTPLPWCNIMANENFGTIISSYGTVYSYFKNSQGYKITNWCNDWISFTPGEKFTGIFEDDYNLIYGFGYSKVIEEDNDIDKILNIYVPFDKNVKVQDITLKNNSSYRKENIEITYKIEPVLGVTDEKTSSYIVTKKEDNILFLKNPYSIDFSNYISYIAFCSQDDSIKYEIDSSNYCIKVVLNLDANESKNFRILLGAVNTNVKEAKDITGFFSINENNNKSFLDTVDYWRKKVVRNYKLPNRYLEIMENGWLLYQTIVCRLFARSGFYQSGGALGYRDQLQDTLSLITYWSEKTRSQIILHSSKQFTKGDVLHWWHEYNGSGIRTYFSDDYLWLPYVLCEYIEKTKDYSLLEEKTPYLEDKPLGNRREVYDIYNNIDVYDTVYNHAKKAIMYSLTRINEKNGLLDIGDGDWNDGFSNIRGQSVWLTFFMMNILDKFLSLAKYKKDDEMVNVCKIKRHIFKHAILDNTWDKDHFVRAFFENGNVLGAYSNNECKIDLISQAWAVIAMKNDIDVKNELKTCLKTADKYLVDRENKLIRLLYPSFDKPKDDPGYIKAYVPGTRENGGQYTHAATWLAKAYLDLNDRKNGIEILNMINPISHSDTKQAADKYMVEPYVIAADIYSNVDHPGRGGWTWYTGSASWMYKVIEDYLTK